MGSLYRHGCVLPISGRAAQHHFTRMKMSCGSDSRSTLSRCQITHCQKTIRENCRAWTNTTIHNVCIWNSRRSCGTNEPLLWQQMRPDRYEASRLWFLRANPRGLSEGTEPWGTWVADLSLAPHLQEQTPLLPLWRGRHLLIRSR